MSQVATVPVPKGAARTRAAAWPKEVVVDHGDGTVSIYSGTVATGDTIRARRAGDVIREDG